MDLDKQHNLAILCKSCNTRWKLSILLTGNRVEAFATLCECGAVIVGNYNRSADNPTDLEITATSDEINKKKYLTNGNFEVLDLSRDYMETLPTLALE